MIIGNFIEIRLFIHKNMANCFQFGRAVQRACNNAGGVQIIWLPKKAGTTFTAKPSSRNIRRLEPCQPLIVGDCDVVLSCLGMGAKVSMKLLTHTAVAVDHTA